MQKTWQDEVKGDPLPWLLEEENPSAHYLTLRHLFDCADCDSGAAEARAAIPAWPPVSEILALMDPVDFWGLADQPFYGGAMSTHATLHLLAELGLPATPALEAACENLLTHGQHENGGFPKNDSTGGPLLCYTGNAARTLIHFGYGNDPRLQRGLDYLAARAAAPDGLACPYADGDECQWGIVKALAAFAEVPASHRTLERAQAAKTLADALLNHTFDFAGQDAGWLSFGFPQDYQSDLVELCDVLARLDHGPDPRFAQLLKVMLATQDDDGRWVKRRGTRALQVEAQDQPSKWITLQALRALKHALRATLAAERIRLRGEGALP